MSDGRVETEIHNAIMRRTSRLWTRMLDHNLLPVVCDDGVIRFVDCQGKVPEWFGAEQRAEIRACQGGLWAVFAIGRAARGVDPVESLARKWAELGWTDGAKPGHGEPLRWERAR